MRPHFLVVVLGSLLLPNFSCTSSRTSHVHHLANVQETTIVFDSCPKSFFIVDESVKSPPISQIEDTTVTDLALSVIKKDLPKLIASERSADLNLTILKAYARNLYTSKSVVVVIKLTSGQLEKELILRGSNVGMNWWNSNSEFKSALKSSFSVAFSSLKDAHSKACQPDV
jgi:hypothetical protein